MCLSIKHDDALSSFEEDVRHSGFLLLSHSTAKPVLILSSIFCISSPWMVTLLQNHFSLLIGFTTVDSSSFKSFVVVVFVTTHDMLILVPGPGIKPAPPAVEDWSPKHQESLSSSFNFPEFSLLRSNIACDIFQTLHSSQATLLPLFLLFWATICMQLLTEKIGTTKHVRTVD